MLNFAFLIGRKHRGRREGGREGDKTGQGGGSGLEKFAPSYTGTCFFLIQNQPCKRKNVYNPYGYIRIITKISIVILKTDKLFFISEERLVSFPCNPYLIHTIYILLAGFPPLQDAGKGRYINIQIKYIQILIRYVNIYIFICIYECGIYVDFHFKRVGV